MTLIQFGAGLLKASSEILYLLVNRTPRDLRRGDIVEFYPWREGTAPRPVVIVDVIQNASDDTTYLVLFESGQVLGARREDLKFLRRP